MLHFLRSTSIITIFLWLSLTFAIWHFRPSTVTSIVRLPRLRIPWVYPQTPQEENPERVASDTERKKKKLALEDGHWIPDASRRDDMLVWGQKTPDNVCEFPSALVKGRIRSQDVDGHAWVLSDGSPLVHFDIERFVVRGLQSRIGYILVGDSLTEGIVAALNMMLLMPNPLSDPKLVSRTWEHGPAKWKSAGLQPYMSNMTLDIRHPLTQKILERWESGEEELRGIPKERILERPLIRQFRSSILSSEEEAAEIILGGMGVSIDWTAQLRIPTPWRELLKKHALDPPWPEEKPSIVMINTGPHWEPDRFQPITDSQMKKAYKLTMAKVYGSLNSFPPDLPLRIMFRSTMTGHEYCERFLYPVTRYDEAAQNPTGNRNGTYHWHWFPEYNAIAKEIWDNGRHSIDRFSTSLVQEGDAVLDWGMTTNKTRDPEEVKSKSGVKTQYWDIWTMSATRPDAHVAWNGHGIDCLHFCPAGVYEWVVRAWWHTIETERI